MGDPVDMVFSGLGYGREGDAEVFGRTSMTQVREELEEDMNLNREQRGLPPLKETEYPGSPTWGGSAVKNIGSLFGGQPQKPTPFSEAYTPPVLRRALIEKGQYTEEEANEYISKLSLYQLMALRHRYPQAYVADPRIALEDPEQVAAAKRAYLGVAEPREGETFKPGDVYAPRSALEALEKEGEMLEVPHAPRGFHNVPPSSVAIDPITGKPVYRNPREDKLVSWNYIDTWADEGSPERLVNFTEAQALEHLKKDKGRYIKDVEKSEVRTGELHDTVRKTVEDQTIKLMELRDQLDLIEDMFDPRWLTWGGRVQGMLLSIGSKLGTLTPEQRMDYFERGLGIAGVAKVTNDMIRLMTGAQMSKAEADRLMVQEINVGDDPDIFIAKLMRSAYFNNLALARNRLILEKGVLKAEEITSGKEWGKQMTFQEFRREMLGRADKMYQQMGVDTGEEFTDSEAKERTREQFQTEYGIDIETLGDRWVARNLGENTVEQLQGLHASQVRERAAGAQ